MICRSFAAGLALLQVLRSGVSRNRVQHLDQAAELAEIVSAQRIEHLIAELLRVGAG